MALSSLSTEYVRALVVASDGGVAVNPTAFAVEMAFTNGANPASTSWKAASWENASGRYYARILVGPAAIVLAVGTHTVWVRITATPEAPVIRAGTLQVT